MIGYSGSDMKSLCGEAAMGPIRSIDTTMLLSIDSAAVRPVTTEDFEVAFAQARASVSQSDLAALKDWNDQFGSFKGGEYDSLFVTETLDGDKEL